MPGIPFAQSYAERLNQIENELMQFYAAQGRSRTATWQPWGYQMAPAQVAGCSTSDYTGLMTAYSELAKAHTELLKSHSDLISSQIVQGSAAVAAARLRQEAVVPAAPATTAQAATAQADKADPHLVAPNQSTRWIVSNSACGDPPEEPSLMDNTLLFLPERAVSEFGLEPNMDDKGDLRKELWFGRVWELRSLLAARYKHKLKAVKETETVVSAADLAALDAKFEHPAMQAKLRRLQARWKGAVLRLRCGLAFLERLKFCNLRGALIYCHGSGGCSWDNMRICRMIARLGILVIAPDGFAYPKNTAMGKLRHKDLQTLHKATDDVDYWAGDLIYASDSSGEATYSTKADSVLADPAKYCDLYERCFQLRRSELHFIIQRLPQYMKTRGFFLGGTSEGGMSVARFDDQRYGEMVCGRFINSFSIEYNYFTPKPEAGEIGGQLDVPTLNIIGTKDEYFGAQDSVAKLVAQDTLRGYGNKLLTGHGYDTMVRQGVEAGLVCVLEDGVHSPCNTHDNFLRQLFDIFFARPESIWELDAIWSVDPTMRDLLQVKQSSCQKAVRANVVHCFVPAQKFPNKWPLRKVELMRSLNHRNAKQNLAAEMAEQAKEVAKEHLRAKEMLDGLRATRKKEGSLGVTLHTDDTKTSYYDDDKYVHVNKLKEKVHG